MYVTIKRLREIPQPVNIDRVAVRSYAFFYPSANLLAEPCTASSNERRKKVHPVHATAVACIAGAHHRVQNQWRIFLRQLRQ